MLEQIFKRTPPPMCCTPSWLSCWSVSWGAVVIAVDLNTVSFSAVCYRGSLTFQWESNLFFLFLPHQIYAWIVWPSHPGLHWLNRQATWCHCLKLFLWCHVSPYFLTQCFLVVAVWRQIFHVSVLRCTTLSLTCNTVVYTTSLTRIYTTIYTT